MSNKNLFQTAMVVLVRCKENFSSKTGEWDRDVQFSQLSNYIYQKVCNLSFEPECIQETVNIINQEVDSFMDTYDDIDNSLDLPYPDDASEQDCWFGTIAGDYFGIPTQETMDKIDIAIKDFNENMEFGSLADVFEEKHPDWFK